MNRFYVLKAAERAGKRAFLGVSSSFVPSNGVSIRFRSRSNAFSSSSLRERERKVSGTDGKERTRVTERDDDERSLRRKEEPQNKFLESLRRETVEKVEQQLDDAEDHAPPTRAFSLREKTYREKRGELNMLPKEINGPRGLEPTRFKDWEVGGRCTDF